MRPDQLAARLRSRLAPLYLVFGEELLQAQEAADAIRAAARAQGYAERECLTVETGFDWAQLRQRAASRSLFASRRLLELRLGSAKPGEAGAKALSDYAAQPAEDTVLLITAGKLDWSTQKSRWFTALDAAGLVVQSALIEPAQWLAWIERRLRQRGLHPTPEAAALLAERMEGNLLAAVQEIEKLALLATGPTLSIEAVAAATSDSARYSIYDFVDAALHGQPERVARILSSLREEGIDPVLINWALHQEVRRLAMLAFAQSRGQSVEAKLAELKIWEKRKPLLRQALQRLNWPKARELLCGCARADRAIKGAELGAPWDELLANGLRLAGLELFPCQALAADLAP